MPGFDPDQPRDEKGQWTSTNSSTALQSAASDVKLDDPEYLLKLLGPNANGEQDSTMRVEAIKDQVEKMNDVADLPTEQIVDTVSNALRYQPFETVAVFTEDGDLIGIQNGNEKEVSMELSQEVANNGIATHNHPLDQSFSNGDIYTTVGLGLQEMRAASAAHEYIVRPNYDYQGDEKIDTTEGDFGSGQEGFEKMLNTFFGPPPLIKTYDRSLMDVQKSFIDAIEIGAMDVKTANEMWQHKTMELFADRTGSYYEKRPLPSVRTDVPRELYGSTSYPDFEQAERKRERYRQEAETIRLNRMELKKKPQDRKLNFN